MSERYDVIVIGAGPAGYVAAIRAAQLGNKVACVERWVAPSGEMALGGTCLNVGCIPSKALLASSEEFEKVGHSLGDHGINVSGVKLDLEKMLARKEGIVNKMTKGIEFLFRKNGITWLKGHGSLEGQADGYFKVKTTLNDEEQINETRNVIIATGSNARHLPDVAVDNEIICDNEGALRFSSVPKRLGVIGAGVIGLELGSVWRRLGAEVIVVEFLDKLLPGMDDDVRKEAAKIFKKQGMELRLSTKVTGCTVKGKKATLTLEPAAGGEAETLDADCVLVSIGRRPNTEGLGLDAIGLETNQRGQIEIDHDFRTKVDGVWAIGDVVPGPMLAHKAEDEGIACAENVAGQTGIVNHDLIPGVVYTWPEFAGVGLTQEEAIEKMGGDKSKVKVGKFPMMANSRAKTNHEPDGFVKIIAEAESDRVLGVWAIASVAGTMISQATQAMEFGATSEDIAYTCHAHPTHSEAIKEAAMAVQGKPIHV